MTKHWTHALFQGTRMIARGSLPEVTAAAWDAHDPDRAGDVIVAFDRETGRQVEFAFGRDRDEAVARAAATVDAAAAVDDALPTARRGRGRPRLGVVGREVTLLPEHWRWLDRQSGSASAVLRRLVHDAMSGNAPSVRAGADGVQAADRFLTAVAGDLPGYEEAVRRLYRGDRERFQSLTQGWPEDICAFALELAGPGWES